MTQREWLGLDNQTRDKIKKHFGIFPTGNTVVRDNVIVESGFSEGQLATIPENWEEVVSGKAVVAVAKYRRKNP